MAFLSPECYMDVYDVPDEATYMRCSYEKQKVGFIVLTIMFLIFMYLEYVAGASTSAILGTGIIFGIFYGMAAYLPQYHQWYYRDYQRRFGEMMLLYPGMEIMEARRLFREREMNPMRRGGFGPRNDFGRPGDFGRREFGRR